jgi:hypothetical protein
MVMSYRLILKALVLSSLVLFTGCVEIPELHVEGWYRGNTHTHARFSDQHNNDDVPKIAGWYKDAGYSFLLLSEHNDHLEKKKIICHDEITDPGKFLMLCGLELSNEKHLTALGITEYTGDEVSLQDGVDKTLAEGGLPILNHPYSSGISMRRFIETPGLNHLEVFNGNRPEQTPFVESLWDSILSAPEGRIVYAIASDDNHYRESKVGRGWIMVKAPELTKEDVENSIKNGNYYATTGVLLSNIIISSESISIESLNGSSISFTGKDGKRLAQFENASAMYTFNGDELYVRATITNNKGEIAWTQPVFPGSK